MSRHLTLLCVQPCHLYYAWQVEVMLTNFSEHGLHIFYSIHCLFAIDKSDPKWKEKYHEVQKVEARFFGVAIFFYYEDTRSKPVYYQPSIRPNILKQHYAKFPELRQSVQFYHDCDMVFTRFPDFLNRMTQDDVWYLSNTISYIGHDYVLSKGEDVLDTMCEIVGINKALIKSNQLSSGGAQYVLKNVDEQFFAKMEADCEKLFYTITTLSTEKKKLQPDYHELQIWCADMWAILWGAWMRGYKTVVDQDLSFCWATEPIENWDTHGIFHNAGVVNSLDKNLFFKGKYRLELPYNIKLEDMEEKYCSYRYCELITKTSQKLAKIQP